MRIAFDQQIFSWQQYGGISRYICSLVTHLSEIPGVEAKIFAPLHVNAHLPMLPADIRTGIKVKVLPKTGRIRLNASRLMAIPLIRAFRPDIIHETYYSDWAYAPKGARRVLTAHDMIHEHFPGMFSTNDPSTNWKKKACSRADHIICISECTRRDLLDLFDVPAEKVSVVYHGFDAFDSEAEQGNKHQNSPYILYVGQRGGYKNFHDFIRAYTSSEWLRNNFRILCFGGGAFTSVEKAMLTANRVNEANIQQIGGADSVLATCYRNAAAFVYPSLYEGFGIPPLEAMSVGCPVVCSDTSSIPEVVGTAGEYFDPTSIDSIRSTIEKVLQSTELQADLTAKGFERCKLFTWEKCAAETLAVYRSL
ncbi:MAG: glycosyltransferase family 4 protein [Proteobacteria bacterium]|nr:glycosyltransferase family 4 protein [Pseudomonadota bacterium]